MTQSYWPVKLTQLSILPTQLERALAPSLANRRVTPSPTSPGQPRRCASSQAAVREAGEHHGHVGIGGNISTPLGQTARQKQANKEFFTDLLVSASTKRDAKAYISRLKSPSKVRYSPTKVRDPVPRVNLGSLYGSTRAAEDSPVFSQYELEQKSFEEQEVSHVALVKLGDIHRIPDSILAGVAGTLMQLARLSMPPCVILESSGGTDGETRQYLQAQGERLVGAIDAVSDGGARLVEDIFTTSLSGKLELALKKLVLVPLRRGQIPVILPTAYCDHDQSIVPVPANEAVLALIQEFTSAKQESDVVSDNGPVKPVSLDRIIVIDQAGGIPSPIHSDGKHVFLNLEQEFAPVMDQLHRSDSQVAQQHVRNLQMLRRALKLLPQSASGLMATPEEAANVTQPEQDVGPSLVGTRRQKNALVYNLLTDKPAYSSSLPKTRLSRKSVAAPPPLVSTFVKHGMPLKMWPDPMIQPWTANGPRIKLTDSQIDLARLVYLIDDSFNRKLDIEDYLKRVNERMAGVIIAGDYEGGAVLTWETPPGCDPEDPSRLVPYLDKFAVLKKSQGAGGVADVVFNAMVRTCFPDGVCWRSRKNNPVNKWYFERSRGTKKIPDMNWTMFWTTPGVAEDKQRFADYEGVCRNVEPSWLDKKMAAD